MTFLCEFEDKSGFYYQEEDLILVPGLKINKICFE